MTDEDKPAACYVAMHLRNVGFTVVATDGTAEALARARIPAVRINKVRQGSPHIVDALKSGTIQLVINTAREASAIRDSYAIRRHAVLGNIPYFTTMSAALAVKALGDGLVTVHVDHGFGAGAVCHNSVYCRLPGGGIQEIELTDIGVCVKLLG